MNVTQTHVSMGEHAKMKWTRTSVNVKQAMKGQIAKKVSYLIKAWIIEWIIKMDLWENVLGGSKG